MTGGAAVVAILILKIATALSLSTGVIAGVKYFNVYEYKPKKADDKGKGGFDRDDINVDHLREGARSRSKV